ncbi:signal peptidase II [Acholeplasma hippikon]|uniref:Lipoprotein signal peptidase n=1 Tax=Acholeplasma hippikon TaxID=264636 RepID=A0A449BJ66_9MOLU|nr:signal peptidase II [Acholeplasma hippikon]VEU82506.1 Lipoprotein signal peptidase [Acholeplasma hippikon]
MILSIALIVFLVLLDFGIKRYFVSIFELNETKVIIEGVLKFSNTRNYGASFGMLQGQSVFFFIVTLIALGAFGYFLATSNFKTKKVYTLSFVFLIAGTLGNGIDRLLLGYVIDYCQMPFLPIVGNTIFNLADVILITGIVLLFVDVMILDTLKKKKKQETEEHE